MSKIKILLVDDSKFFKDAVSSHLGNHPKIEIIGTAADAFEAKDKINELSPHVMVLDIEMPKMDGITFLKQLLQQYYIPCVMVTSSSVSEKEVLDAGAAAFLRKPKSPQDMGAFCTMLATKVLLASAKKPEALPRKGSAAINIDGLYTSRTTTSSPVKSKVDPIMPGREDIAGAAKKGHDGYIVALGASTGGTDALECVIKSFPANMPPVVVVQHMPPVFTKLYAERLDRTCAMHVKEAEDGDRLKPGTCIIGAGGLQLYVKKDAQGYYVKSIPGEKVSGHCPSVDVLFTSVSESVGNKAIAAILTGMGADGAKGLLKMHNQGAYTIGQNKETCVVYGMPMEAYKLGACAEQQPLESIGAEICRRLALGWNARDLGFK